MVLRVALFINPAKYATDQLLNDHVVRFTGQRKRKTFDNWFAPETDADFFLFYRHYRFGWSFTGKASSVRQISERTDTNPPVWELELRNEVNEVNDEYISKETILERVGVVSKYRNMSTGIIPLE